MNWINNEYPNGSVIEVVDVETGQLERGRVVSHYCEGGLKGVAAAGVIVKFPSGRSQRVAAAFLDEDGEDRVEKGGPQ